MDKLNNQTSVPLSIDRLSLKQIGVDNSELDLVTAVYLTYMLMPYTIQGKPACILGLSDIARYYNLQYQTIYAASNNLIQKKLLEKVGTKLVLTPTIMHAMNQTAA